MRVGFTERKVPTPSTQTPSPCRDPWRQNTYEISSRHLWVEPAWPGLVRTVWIRNLYSFLATNVGHSENSFSLLLWDPHEELCTNVANSHGNKTRGESNTRIITNSVVDAIGLLVKVRKATSSFLREGWREVKKKRFIDNSPRRTLTIFINGNAKLLDPTCVNWRTKH